MVKPGSEELRQNVFSSIHMSTLVKNMQATVSYPCCSFCGGASVKGSAKRKVVLCQLSLYTNPSESFVVWYKKLEEPKGLLWLRSCCVQRGQEGAVELISRGCRGRCSYTLKFAAPSAIEEWYRLLRQESRRTANIGDELQTDGDSSSLDSVLTEMTPSSSEVYSEDDENCDEFDCRSLQTNQPSLVNESAAKPIPKKLKPKRKIKSVPILCSPFQGLSRRKHSLPMNSSYTSSTQTIMPLESIENVHEDSVSRWSWPLRV